MELKYKMFIRKMNIIRRGNSTSRYCQNILKRNNEIKKINQDFLEVGSIGPKQKLRFGPLEDLEFERVTEIKGKEAEPWAGEPVDYLNIDDAIKGIKGLEQLHKSLIDYQ